MNRLNLAPPAALRRDPWPPVFPVQGGPDTALYHRLVFDVRDTEKELVTDSHGKVREFKVRGDHLTVAELWGDLAFYVQLGNPQNPWLRVYRGDVLRHPFQSFKARFVIGNPADFAPNFAAATQRGGMVLYVSTGGPLIASRQPSTYAMRAPYIANTNATTTPQSLHQLFRAVNTSFMFPTYAINGGTLMLQNVDLSNDLHISFRRPNEIDVSPSIKKWTIPAGAVLTMRMDGVLDPSSVVPHASVNDLVYFTEAGTCKFQAMISSADADSGHFPQPDAVRVPEF